MLCTWQLNGAGKLPLNSTSNPTPPHPHTADWSQLHLGGPLVLLASLLHFPSSFTLSLTLPDDCCLLSLKCCLLSSPLPHSQLKTLFPILLRRQKQLEFLQAPTIRIYTHIFSFPSCSCGWNSYFMGNCLGNLVYLLPPIHLPPFFTLVRLLPSPLSCPYLALVEVICEISIAKCNTQISKFTCYG